MPRGRGGGHKGQRRHFTSPEEIDQQVKKQQREDEWRKENGSDIEESSDGESGSGSGSEDSSDEEGEPGKAKGVEGLIEISNPNYVQPKTKKVSQVNVEKVAAGPQLTRKEREEIEKQKAKAHYQKLHAEGKTEEARNDMARLQLIRKQREEAAQKRAEEIKTKESAKADKVASTKKAIGKRT